MFDKIAAALALSDLSYNNNKAVEANYKVFFLTSSKQERERASPNRPENVGIDFVSDMFFLSSSLYLIFFFTFCFLFLLNSESEVKIS